MSALLANGAAVADAGRLNPESAGYLQSCAETANRSLLAALSMMSRLAAVNLHAAEHCRVDFRQVEETLWDLTALVSEAAPVLTGIAVDAAASAARDGCPQ